MRRKNLAIKMRFTGRARWCLFRPKVRKWRNAVEQEMAEVYLPKIKRAYLDALITGVGVVRLPDIRL